MMECGKVKIMGYLKSDDGICFSLEELMFVP